MLTSRALSQQLLKSTLSLSSSCLPKKRQVLCHLKEGSGSFFKVFRNVKDVLDTDKFQ